MAERVEVPDDVATMNLLGKVDYEDAFTAFTTDGRTPGQWFRLALRAAPDWLHSLVRAIQGYVLGFRLAAADSTDHPLGWHVLADDSAVFVLGVEGGLLTARIVVISQQRRMVVSTLLRYDHPAARPVWSAIAPVHRLVARRLVDGAPGAAATERLP